MDYFIADTHFGHEKMRALRGFASVREMDEALINAWNTRVQPEDHIYIVGDLIYRSDCPATYYLEKLNGIKHLAIGNHDRQWLRLLHPEKWFVECAFILEGERDWGYFTASHYPMMDWYRRRHGAHLVYGHIHNMTKDPYYHYLQTVPRAYNAGVEVNEYRPVTIQELMENTQLYRAQHQHGRVRYYR